MMRASLRLAAATLALFASPTHATPVTVNELDKRPLEEVATALGPLIVSGLKLRSFEYGRPFGPFPSPGSATAIFDHRSYYAPNGVCVLEQWWFRFVPQVTYGPEKSGSEGMPPDIIGNPRDAPLKLDSITPWSTYWVADRDVEAEMPLSNYGVFDEEDQAVMEQRAPVSATLCREVPKDANFFGAKDNELASRGLGAFRRIVARLQANPASLKFQCSYTANECSELKRRLSLDELAGIRECDYVDARKERCVRYSVGVTGTMQGTYVSVQVETSSDFNNPDDFTINLHSRAFVSH